MILVLRLRRFLATLFSTAFLALLFCKLTDFVINFADHNRAELLLVVFHTLHGCGGLLHTGLYGIQKLIHLGIGC